MQVIVKTLYCSHRSITFPTGVWVENSQWNVQKQREENICILFEYYIEYGPAGKFDKNYIGLDTDMEWPKQSGDD